ncbi:MAG: hypothetical protein AAGE98_01380 [Actinomycetota bacterium]
MGAGTPDKSRVLVLELDTERLLFMSSFGTPTDAVNLADDTIITVSANGTQVQSAEFRRVDEMLSLRARGRVVPS